MTRSCPTRRASDLPIAIDDHQNSPWIVRPLHLLDCCLISDGAVCVIITSTERARDLRKPPVLIAGFGQAHTTMNLEQEDWWYVPHQKRALADAFAMAGCTTNDIQTGRAHV